MRKVIFAALVALCTLPPDGSVRAGDRDAARPPVLVRTAPVTRMRFVETVTADGTVASKNFALVSPRLSGAIDAVFVREGDVVRGGETRLFQTDNSNLLQAIKIKRQDLELAKSSLAERAAALESAAADAEQAERDYARNHSLYENRVMTLSEFEQSQSRLDQLLAVQKVNRMQVVLAEQTVERETIAVEVVAKEYSDSIAIAPIDGVVTKRLAEPGEIGMPGIPVVRIDDVRDLKAVVHLPGTFYPRVRAGLSRAILSVNGGDAAEFAVTYKSPAIDSAYRTFEVWVDVPGDGEYVVPGAECVASVVLLERSGLGVPRDAVQFRDGKHWIFVPVDGRAEKLEVVPGLERDGYIELLDPPFAEGRRVVVEGQFLLDAGVPVRE